VLLGWLGSKPPEGGYVVLSRVLTIWYFAHFLVLLPLLGFFETPRPVPNSISEALKVGRKAAVVVLAGGLAATALVGGPRPAAAPEHAELQPPRNTWSFAGPFGKFDRGQLQRGFKVYHDVCQTCHSLSLLSFRNLGEEGGPEFSAAEVAA